MVELFETKIGYEMMTLDEYQEACLDTAFYPHSMVYPALGLASETGELLGKIKKLVRDDGMPLDIDDVPETLDHETTKQLALEVGDCLYYLAVLADDIGYSLEEIADMNMKKLKDRKSRGTLEGSGDTR